MGIFGNNIGCVIQFVGCVASHHCFFAYRIVSLARSRSRSHAPVSARSLTRHLTDSLTTHYLLTYSPLELARKPKQLQLDVLSSDGLCPPSTLFLVDRQAAVPLRREDLSVCNLYFRNCAHTGEHIFHSFSVRARHLSVRARCSCLLPHSTTNVRGKERGRERGKEGPAGACRSSR